jgi:hypothetical protein
MLGDESRDGTDRARFAELLNVRIVKCTRAVEPQRKRLHVDAQHPVSGDRNSRGGEDGGG